MQQSQSDVSCAYYFGLLEAVFAYILNIQVFE